MNRTTKYKAYMGLFAFIKMFYIELLPPKLQRRGLVFERKLVTVECVMGYYGTCDGLLWDVCAGYCDST